MGTLELAKLEVVVDEMVVLLVPVTCVELCTVAVLLDDDKVP